MKASIDELINDINQATYTEIVIKIHTGTEVIIKSFHYTNLRISKDDKGAIALGNYESKEGYIITNEYEIEKADRIGHDGKSTYHISDKDIPLIDIYIKQ
jgi:hypothetical protein